MESFDRDVAIPFADDLDDAEPYLEYAVTWAVSETPLDAVDLAWFETATTSED